MEGTTNMQTRPYDSLLDNSINNRTWPYCPWQHMMFNSFPSFHIWNRQFVQFLWCSDMWKSTIMCTTVRMKEVQCSSELQVSWLPSFSLGYNRERFCQTVKLAGARSGSQSHVGNVQLALFTWDGWRRYIEIVYQISHKCMAPLHTLVWASL